LARKELAVASRHHQDIFHHDSRPTHPLFPRLKIKWKGRQFETIKVIEAESQTLLYILTEHDFQDAFKKWQKRWGERCIRAEWDYFECDGGR
jgi:hypothetical protein